MKTIAIRARKNWRLMEIMTTVNMILLYIKLKISFRQKLNSLAKEK